MDNNLCKNGIQASSDTSYIRIRNFMWPFLNKTIFRLFPTWLRFPRIMLLRIFGAKLAKTVIISRTTTIYHPWNLEMDHLSIIGSNSNIYCDDKIKIGKQCRIGSNVNIATQDHSDKTFIQTKGITVIGNGCWISAGCSIRQGVNLGQYTMVGAQSLVVSDTEPFMTVSGSPAKEINKAIINYC
ncbi:transferase hexapeptide repeat containing protein [Paludibacter propionicigenes WB4]|uniref:Transferase hexapeptide repeat containing protein n=1 Tax=Paludibacter propionicigenes (strain DSM 17365 / JCM 13257 / WB4) TaxID=694427 RepID=E4T1I1_PALPW|nr:transferase hexapeptide repeat containing protein [Paludibacter propionicigenes]ADQ78575.1 transferase hexapeptide repeat containing protein [Paludibacter propionicigenes WB4]